jgi:DNA-binding transcriptional LysR family regulator
MFTIKQLEALYWSSELGTFEAAADYLNVAQSTISKRIAELERQFPDPLFERSGRQSILTVHGEAVREIARQILQLNDRLMAAAKDTNRLPMRVRLGVTDLVATSWLPELLRRLQQSYPSVEFEPEINLTAILIERMIERKIDFVITPRGTMQSQFINVPIDQVNFEWMCSPKMWEGRTRIETDELLTATLLAQSAASVLRPALYTVIDNENLVFARKINCNNMNALAELAANEMGVTILPSAFFKSYIASGRLHVVETPVALPKLHYHVTFRNDYHMGFYSEVADICVQLGRLSNAQSSISADRRNGF